MARTLLRAVAPGDVVIPVCVDPLLAHCGRGGWRTYGVVRPHRTSCFGSVCAFGGLRRDETGSHSAIESD